MCSEVHATKDTAAPLLVVAEQVEWKLKRGKWRPRLLEYAKAHSDEIVRSASSEAFQAAAAGDAQHVLAALAPLTKLKASCRRCLSLTFHELGNPSMHLIIYSCCLGSDIPHFCLVGHWACHCFGGPGKGAASVSLHVG